MITRDQFRSTLKDKVALLKANGVRAQRGSDLEQHGQFSDWNPADDIQLILNSMDEAKPEQIQENRALIERARRGDPAAITQLNELRLEQSDNYILATSNIATMFFKTVSLGPSDRPLYRNVTSNEVKVYTIGQDNLEPRQTRVPKNRGETLIDLYDLSTESAEYPLTDIYAGPIGNEALATFDLAYDMAKQWDYRAKALLDASAFAAWVTTGAKHLRTYALNSHVVSTNLPTTNAISLDGNDGDSLLRLDAFRKAVQYAGRWGANAFKDGDLRLTGNVLVPSYDIADVLFDTEVVPNAETDRSNPVALQVMQGGYRMFSFGGMSWNLIPDNTLTPGACYFQFNKPVGTIYTKPSRDEDGMETNRKKNSEHRWLRRCFGINMPEHQRLNILKVTYRS